MGDLNDDLKKLQIDDEGTAEKKEVESHDDKEEDKDASGMSACSQLTRAIKQAYFLAVGGSLQVDPSVTSNRCDEWARNLLDHDEVLGDECVEGLMKKIELIRRKLISKESGSEDTKIQTVVQQMRAPVPVRQLTEYTFELWDLDLKEKFRKEKLTPALDSELPVDDEMNLTAYNKLITSVPGHMLSLVIDTRSTFQAYAALKSKYGERNQKRQSKLEKEIEKLKLKGYDDKVVTDFVNEFCTAVGHLKSAGGIVEPSKFSEWLSDSLPDDDSDQYLETIKASIRASADEDAAVERFTKECSRLFKRGKGIGDVSQLARYRGRGSYQNNWRRPYEQGQWQRKVICFKCGEEGHISRICKNSSTLSKPEIKNKDKDLSNYSNVSRAQERPTVCADSGTNAHHLPSVTMFSDIDRSRRGTVTVANGQESTVQGFGNAVIQNETGSLLLNDVRLTPEFTMGLLSVGRLAKEGFTVIFDNEQAIVTRMKIEVPPELVNFSIPKVGDLYETEVTVPQDTACAALSSMELHSAWGHPGEKATKELKKMYPDLQFGHQEFCETCVLGKQRQLPYRSTHNDSYKPLDVIHTDICESKCRGYRNEYYVVTFVDEYSKYAEIYPLTTKSSAAVLEKFRDFQARMERQLQTTIKKVRSDNGREYLGEFEKYLKSSGIQHQFTVPYRHQQNGTAERFNRTLLSKARCLMIEACLPYKYWPLAMQTACYQYNLSPHSSIDFEAPVKKLFPDTRTIIERGRKLHVFGSRAYKEIPMERRNVMGANKFDPVSEEFVFAGYESLDSDNYVLLNPETGAIIKERNVMVKDDVFPCCTKKKEGTCKCQESLSTSQSTEQPLIAPEFMLSFVHSSGGEASQVGRVENDRHSGRVEEASGGCSPSLSNSELNDDDDDDSTLSIVTPTAPRNEGPSAPSDRPLDEENGDIDDGLSLVQSSQRELRDRNTIRQPVRYGFNSVESEDKALAVCTKPSELREPGSYEEAMESPQEEYWREACNEEMKSWLENQVYEEVLEERDMKVISCKFVFKIKRNSEGAIVRHKSRLVALGYVQRFNVDYWETYAPTVAATTLRTFLTICKKEGMMIGQVDVTTAFLYGDIDGEIYLRPPTAYSSPGKVWRLRKSVYGLKQSPKCWSEKLNAILKKQGFLPTKSDRCLFVRGRGTAGLAYVLVYVDDCLIAAPDEQTLDNIKDELKRDLNIKDLGPLGTFIGIDFKEISEGVVSASQERYIDELADRFKVTEANPLTKLPRVDTEELDREPVDLLVPYRSLVGALLYIASMTRPDISAAISYLSRYLDRPSRRSWKLAKQVLNYLRHTKKCPLMLGKLDDSSIVTYADANFAPAGDRKSQSGAVIKLAGSTVGWFSKKQKTVSTSTTEAEYIALSAAMNETIWLKNLLCEMGVAVVLPISIFEDNQPAIAIATNQRNPGLAKHLDVKYHAISDYHQKGVIRVSYIPSRDQLADGLTKVLNDQTMLDRLLGKSPESGGVLRQEIPRD